LSSCSNLETLSSKVGLIVKDRAIGVMIPLITIISTILIVALSNYMAKKDSGSIRSSFIIQDRKYSSNNRETFSPSTLAKIPQANIRYSTQIPGFLMKVSLHVLVLYQ